MIIEIPPTHFPWDPKDPEPVRAHGPWLVTLHWDEVNGRLECVHFEIRHGTGPRPVTTTLLRQLNLGRQITRWRRQLVIDADMVLDEDAADLFSPELRSYMAETKRLAEGRRRRHGPDHYAEVAAVYSIAYRNGEPPTKAVADHFTQQRGKRVPRSTAAKWVMKSRELGMLPPTTQRRPIGQPIHPKDTK